jgi:hypothetical protein
MQTLVLALLFAFSASADEAEGEHRLAIEGLRVGQTPTDRLARQDPCGVARQIVHQPPCLAADDCRALQLWQRSFGPPRIAPLDPERTSYRSLAAGRGSVRHPPPVRPDPRRLLTPDTVCPAGTARRR